MKSAPSGPAFGPLGGRRRYFLNVDALTYQKGTERFKTGLVSRFSSPGGANQNV